MNFRDIERVNYCYFSVQVFLYLNQAKDRYCLNSNKVSIVKLMLQMHLLATQLRLLSNRINIELSKIKKISLTALLSIRPYYLRIICSKMIIRPSLT